MAGNTGYAEVAERYAGKIYSLIPVREKKRLKNQVPRVKKMSNKLINLLQRELARAKNAKTSDQPGRIAMLRENSLSNALSLAEKVVQSIHRFESLDAFPVLEPVPHRQHKVIPEKMQMSANLSPVESKKLKRKSRKIAADREQLEKTAGMQNVKAKTTRRTRNTETLKNTRRMAL